MPNGRRLKQNRPSVVMNVVSSFDGSSSGSCQNPLFASNLVKNVLPANLLRLSSTDFMG